MLLAKAMGVAAAGWLAPYGADLIGMPEVSFKLARFATLLTVAAARVFANPPDWR
jgi:hypothetical protein